MSRSGYSEDGDYLNLYRASVARAISGKRGQEFLRTLAQAMDAMPVKRLISEELQNRQGEVCAIGAYCKFKNIDVSKVNYELPKNVGELVGIATAMAAEIEFENDQMYDWRNRYSFNYQPETPEQRFIRIRQWVEDNLKKV